jgi:hypothetical protein
MSSLPSGSQAPNGNNSSDDNGDRQRSIVFAWVIALGLVLLIVLFLSPGWLVPHIEATQDNTTPQVEEINVPAQVEEIDAGAEEETEDIPDEVQPLSNETISVNDITDDGTSEPVANVPVIQIDTTPDTVNEEVTSTNDEEKITTTTGGGGWGGGGGNSHRSHGGSGDGAAAGDDENPVDDDENTGGEDNGGQNGSESDEGCTVQYWQDHPESWPEPLSPTTSFSSVFGITIPGMDDLTLMDALGLEGDLVNELLSEGSAGFLNAAHHDIHYYKSQETVTSNVVDGLDPQVVQSEEHADDNDIENRISRLVTENYRACPLLVNE